MIRRRPGDTDDYLIAAVEWHRGARDPDDAPPPRPPRVVSLRKQYSGETERQQWRATRHLLTGEWPA